MAYNVPNYVVVLFVAAVLLTVPLFMVPCYGNYLLFVLLVAVIVMLVATIVNGGFRRR